MRRMLDPTKVGGLPSTIEFDKEGNRKVKKNLGVDGKLTLKSLVSNTNPDGDITKELGGKLYCHCIELNGTNNGHIFFNYYTSRKEPFSSINDFVNEVSEMDFFACSGTIKVNGSLNNAISIRTVKPSGLYARYYTTESPYIDSKDISTFFIRDDVYNI